MTEGDQEYAEREKCFNDIVALNKPDRVPIVPLVETYFSTTNDGVSKRDAHYDDEKRYSSMKKSVLKYGWDFAPPTGLFSGGGYQALGTTQLQWPGGTLPDNVGFQYVEGDYMKAEEYREFLANPDGFTVRTMLPRIASNLEGLGMLPPLFWLSNTYYLMNVGGILLAQPPLRKALESLLAMSDAVAALFAAEAAYDKEMADLGYPRVWSAPIIPPFDIVSDFWRSLKGSTLDIYRNPDELLAATALAQEAQIGLARMVLQLSGNPRVFIPMHRGAKGFMSDEQFEKFYWPSLEALVLAIIDAGGVPCPLFEGDYTPRLKYLATLPAGKIAGHFDKVDRVECKKVLGDTMCFWGNVPASLLCTATPREVKEDVKSLIDLFGDTGTLMIDCNLGIPDEARPENVMAMREAVEEFGVL